MIIRNFAQTAYCAFFALTLPVFVLLLGGGCSKYTTDKELQDELDKNSASVAQAIYDSLSHVYNGVEVYSGSSAGGDANPPFQASSLDTYTGTNHYRSLLIPGGLNPGDKVFVVAELRFGRSGSNNINVIPQSAITITNSPNIHPNPGGPDPQPNLFPVAPHNSDATWNLGQQYQTIDRSGMYTQTSSTGKWNTAYVNFHARVVYSDPTSSTLSASNHSLSVIVVRA